MKVIAIDPGYTMSAWIVLEGDVPRAFGREPNDDVLARIRSDWETHDPNGALLAVEMIASYGMPVGREIFGTCLWVGRYIEAWTRRGGSHCLVYRKDVKLHLCKSSKAKDANVRAALLDLYGPGKERAIGTKKKPGPLYGISGDVWAALGVGLTAQGGGS